MATTTEVRSATAAERVELAGVLADLSSEAWDELSLCAGWRVREVVAHMTMAFRYSTGRFIVEMIKAGGRFNVMADRSARRDASELSPDELTSSLRDHAHHPWKPPGGGYEGALSHDVIHGLDITVALGLERRVPLDRLRIVMDGVKPKQIRYFGVDLEGVELRADDIQWRFGSGAPLTGAAQDLLLVLCGRKLPPGHLVGDASRRFTVA